ncbi:MAG: metallophosphoesterase [Bdellovibrionales bacterium]|nr:metallophosphoesterase [Bdellovibrionales bacterium]
MEYSKKQPFLVGDIHGCFFEFMDLLETLNYDSQKHRLILMGDIINRGPHSWEMLQWVKIHNVEAIQGNHEEAFTRFARRNRPITPALDELKQQMGKDLEDWLTWIESWPLYIEEEDFIAVHAGLAPEKHPKDSDIRTLLYIRTWDEKNKTLGDSSHPPWYEFYKGNKLIIYGHWAKQGLQVRQNTIGLDSGCVYGKKLSGILLPERKIFQVPARQNYCSPARDGFF